MDVFTASLEKTSRRPRPITKKVDQLNLGRWIPPSINKINLFRDFLAK